MLWSADLLQDAREEQLVNVSSRCAVFHQKAFCRRSMIAGWNRRIDTCTIWLWRERGWSTSYIGGVSLVGRSDSSFWHPRAGSPGRWIFRATFSSSWAWILARNIYSKAGRTGHGPVTTNLALMAAQTWSLHVIAPCNELLGRSVASLLWWPLHEQISWSGGLLVKCFSVENSMCPAVQWPKRPCLYRRSRIRPQSQRNTW